MQAAALKRLHRLKTDLLYYAPRCLKFLDKDGNLLPFKLNQAQLFIHAKLEEQLAKTGKVRAIILKGRQQGASTYIQARFYHKVQFRKGRKALILTHESTATDNLFAMTNRYHEHVPDELRPSTDASNAKELTFGKLMSGYKVATAGAKGTGRSATAQLFHGSECAFWPHADSHFAGLGQAVSRGPGTEMILESTANGVGNAFHKRWLRAVRGKGEFIAIFVPWYWQPEYSIPAPADFEATTDEMELADQFGLTNDQLLWRRMKLEDDFAGDVSLFQQEYPNTPDEAFQAAKRDTLVDPKHVMAARKAQGLPHQGPLVVGVDPARFGDDRTAILWRRGRVVVKIKTYEKKTTMQVAGIVTRIIEDEKPARVFIDTIGLGVGVYDRLVELNYEDTVAAVQNSEKADDEDRYRNKRAECWGRMRDWFAAGPVQIPDSDEVQADICEPGYSYDSHGRLLIESKENIKKRGAKSPDIADALAMTFAEHVRPKKQQNNGDPAIFGILDELTGY